MSRRTALALLALAGTAVAVAGCGGGTQVAEIPAREITFPVLWAGTDAKGMPVGGIEPAGISVETKNDPGFTVSLDDVKAKGAGPQWLAATAMAGAVATLTSGADPSSVDLGYTITGPIDGPSGGAALTVGTLAAIRGDAVKPGVAMTGTVSPDGTIGTVSGVPTKIRAAAKAGYTTVLIPPGNINEYDSKTGREVHLPAFGKSLGVTVRIAQGIAQAYPVFTGKSLAPPVTGTPDMTPQATAVARRITRRSVAAMSAAGAPTADVQAATRALAAGNLPLAYAVALDARQRVARTRAAARIGTAVARDGLPAVRAQVAKEATALATMADAATTRDANPAGLDAGQWMTLPVALGWTTYAKANAQGVTAFLRDRGAPGQAALADAARVLADVRLAVTAFGPDAVAMVKASPSTRTMAEASTAQFLSGYTNFMVRAGAANRDLYEKVSQGQVGAGTAGDILLSFTALGTTVAQTPSQQNPLQGEIVQSANAITYYVLGNTLVTGSSFGLTGFGLGTDPQSAEPARLEYSVQASAAGTDAWLGDDQAQGWNVSPGAWSSAWGTAAYASLKGGSRSTAGAALALNELWYGGINGLMLRAAARVPPPEG